MRQSLLITLFLNLFLVVYSQEKKQSKAIDEYVRKIIQMNEIPGIAVGVIKNNKIVFEQYYGTETLEDPKKVNPNSMFMVYSTTKLITNTGVFKLIEEGKIALEDKLPKYLDHLPAEWQNVQIENLLTHSSGLPDCVNFSDISVNATNAEVIERLSKEKMEFETGNEFRYNQTNYLLLAMIIEKVTGKTYENFITETQFPNANNQMIFSSNSIEKIPNRIVKYIYNTDTKQYEKSKFIGGVRALSANGLAISLPAFLQWSRHLDKNEFLREETKRMMWKPFDFKNKKDVFGHGWEISEFNNIKSYGFSGGNVSAYRIYPDDDMAIVVMLNGYKNHSVHYRMINYIAGLMDKRLMNPYLLAEYAISTQYFAHPNVQKKIYGYRIENDKVVFNYQHPENMSGELIKNMSIAGAFNDWNNEDQSYQMVSKGNNTYELVVPKSKFEKGKTYGFKFIINKDGWLSAPYTALNNEGTDDNNLTLKIN